MVQARASNWVMMALGFAESRRVVRRRRMKRLEVILLLLFIVTKAQWASAANGSDDRDRDDRQEDERSGQRAIKAFEAAFATLQEPIDAAMNQSFRALLFETAGDSQARRSFLFNETKLLDERLKEANMTIRHKVKLQNDPASMLVLMFNATTIVMSRRVSKFYYWESIQKVLSAIIFCMIVVGNISILHRLKSCRRRRSNVNYFIVQLAIADLCVGVFNVTLDSLLRSQLEFTYGLVACKASKYITIVFIYSSTYLLVALSIDRWEAVVKPLAFTRNRSRGCYLVLGAWALACLSAMPATLRSQIKEVEGRSLCNIDFDPDGWKIYMAYILLSILIVPAIIIAICYTHIVYTIWSKGQLVVQQQRRAPPPISAPADRTLSKSAPGASLAASSCGVQVQAGRPPPSHLAAAVDSTNSSSEPPTASDGGAKTEARQEAEEAAGPPAAAANQARLGNQLARQVALVEAADLSQEEDEGSTEDEYVSTEEEEQPLEVEEDGSSSGQQDGQSFVMARALVGQKQQKQTLPLTTTTTKMTTKRGQKKKSKLETSQAYQVTKEQQQQRQFSSSNSRREYGAGAQQHGSGVIPKARVKTIKMTLVIVAAFILCWSPFCIINLCSVYGLMQENSWTLALMTLSQTLAHLNSAVNPIIYWLFSSKRSRSAAHTAASSDARRQSAKGGHQNQNKASNLKPRWNSVICCRFLYCCNPFGKSGRLVTDSRVFEVTGTTQATGSHCMASRQSTSLFNGRRQDSSQGDTTTKPS